MPVVTIHHPIVRECLYVQLPHSNPLVVAKAVTFLTHSPIFAIDDDEDAFCSFLSNSRAFDMLTTIFLFSEQQRTTLRCCFEWNLLGAMEKELPSWKLMR